MDYLWTVYWFFHAHPSSFYLLTFVHYLISFSAHTALNRLHVPLRLRKRMKIHSLCVCVDLW